jgi:FkbM family methyltransferase
MPGLFDLKLTLLRQLGRKVPLRGRHRIIKFLENSDKLRDYPFVEPFYGFRYPGNLKRSIDWMVFFYGAYSGHELSLLGDLVSGIRADRDGPVVAWDIGANVGHHSLFLSSVCERVISFEPIPYNAALLREKLALNEIDIVALQEVALGEAEDEMPLHHPNFEVTANVGTASFHAGYNPGANIQQMLVRITVGDDYRVEKDLPAPDIIKIDVEGFERPALAGLSNTIREAAPAVLMETSGYTWKNFPSLADLQAVLPDMALFELRATPDPMNYRAAPLRFGKSGEIFAIPNSRPRLQAAFAPALDGVIERPRL